MKLDAPTPFLFDAGCCSSHGRITHHGCHCIANDPSENKYESSQVMIKLWKNYIYEIKLGSFVFCFSTKSLEISN